MINSGPVVRFPTIKDRVFQTMPDDRYGIPPLMVKGSTSTFKTDEIVSTSFYVAFGCTAAPSFVDTIIEPV